VMFHVVQHNRSICAAGKRDAHRKQAVVGSDEHASTATDAHGDGASRRADTWVDDGQHDATWHIRDAARQSERTCPHIKRSNLVREIYHSRVWREVCNHALYDANELVASAIVGKKRDGVIALGVHDAVTLRTRRGRCALDGKKRKGRCQPPDGTDPYGATLLQVRLPERRAVR